MTGRDVKRRVKARYIGRLLNVDLHLGLPPPLRMDEADLVADRIRFALKRRLHNLGDVNIIYE